MRKVKNRAWFIDRDGRYPSLSLHIIYDRDKNQPWSSVIHFKAGKPVDLEEVGTIYFYVEDTKKSSLENIYKWDFLPNSTGIPLANQKALKLLEKIAPEEFQAIPTKILMPDGYEIEEYKLVNIISKVDALNKEKSIFKSQYMANGKKIYRRLFYNLDCLNNLNLARDANAHIFFGSDNLRKAIKNSKLIGVQFKDSYGIEDFFWHEDKDKKQGKL